jgi:V8-like Glu-specific endopeptidase
MKRVLSVSIICILLLTTLAGVAAPWRHDDATAAGPDPNEQVSSSADSPMVAAQSAEDIVNYWTVERMRNAKPYDVANRSDEPKQARNLSPQGPAGGAEPAIGSLPTGNISGVEGAAVAPGESVANYTYPFPYSRLNVFTPYTHQYYRVSGKVFFTMGGANFVCSGTLVNSPNKSLVITAGHCVHGGGAGKTWHTNWSFVPAYKNGNRPYGTWTSNKLYALNGWTNNADFTYDIGAAVLQPRASDSARAVNLLGGRGMRWNVSRLQHFWDLGYPADPPFNGQLMMLCTASHAFDDAAVGAGPSAIGIGCDMTGGASGGGWVIGFGSASANYVNGVNSYKYTTAQPLAMYSPYFGNGAQTIFNTAGSAAP